MDVPEEMKANLAKLRALSKDDLTENGLLRSRIDQQCELICILKQRADESLKRSMTLEGENSEIKKHRDEILTALHNETRKYSVLEKRFVVLNQNHEELIKIKDGYKTENGKLRIENDRLKKENEDLFGSLEAERDLQIKQFREEVKNFQEKYQVATTKETFVGSDININVRLGEEADLLFSILETILYQRIYSQSSPWDHSHKRPALVMTTFVKLICDLNFVMKSSCKQTLSLATVTTFGITQLDSSFVVKPS